MRQVASGGEEEGRGGGRPKQATGSGSGNSGGGGTIGQPGCMPPTHTHTQSVQATELPGLTAAQSGNTFWFEFHFLNYMHSVGSKDHLLSFTIVNSNCSQHVLFPAMQAYAYIQIYFDFQS